MKVKLILKEGTEQFIDKERIERAINFLVNSSEKFDTLFLEFINFLRLNTMEFSRKKQIIDYIIEKIQEKMSILDAESNGYEKLMELNNELLAYLSDYKTESSELGYYEYNKIFRKLWDFMVNPAIHSVNISLKNKRTCKIKRTLKEKKVDLTIIDGDKVIFHVIEAPANLRDHFENKMLETNIDE